MSMVGVCNVHLYPELYPGYQLHRQLGQGGFGEVWQAEKAAGKFVALKFLRCSGNDSWLHELRSLQLVRTLDHPNLLHLDQVWAARDYLIIAMPLADCSLADLLDIYQSETGSAIPALDLLPLLLQAARGIDFLNAPKHLVDGRRLGIQHGDVSPGNLLLFGETIKLSDFSLTAVMMGPRKSRVAAGKPALAAPEVFQEQLSNQSDQYSLAVSYCQLRGGRLPFPDTPPDFKRSYVRPEPDLSMLEPYERPMVARALASTPEARWPTCVEWVELLAVNRGLS
jgi:serine/threonine protein kinase, bacterial